jgi:hypothetical protein
MTTTTSRSCGLGEKNLMKAAPLGGFRHIGSKRKKEYKRGVSELALERR